MEEGFKRHLQRVRYMGFQAAQAATPMMPPTMPEDSLDPIEFAGEPAITLQARQVWLAEGERDVFGGHEFEGVAAGVPGVDGVTEALRLTLPLTVVEGVGLCDAPVEGVVEGVAEAEGDRDVVGEFEGVADALGVTEMVAVGEGPGTPPLETFCM
jgi:hypothetical protein